MKLLVLFDIDGTLLTGAAGHKKAFSYAFKTVYGVDASIDIIQHSGMTDQQIILEVLKSHQLPKNQITKKIKQCMEAMQEYYVNISNEETPKVLPGVKKLLKNLKNSSFGLGLVTGNLETIGRGKLKSVGINHYF